MSLLSLHRLVPRFSTRLCSSQAGVAVGGAGEAPCSKNDIVAPRVRNKNPMNLEKMLIGKTKEAPRLGTGEQKQKLLEQA